MKQYQVEYVERGGFPGAPFEWFDGESDKAVKKVEAWECYLNKSINRGHCGIRIFRVNSDTTRKCILSKFRGA